MGAQPIEFAEPLEPPGDKARILDKLWIWIVIAIILIAAAYAYPIAEHLATPRFGARGLSPF